jgi:N-succinyldiaminopimelate aminotransferase
MNPIYASISTSVFERMSALALEHQAYNLGQGFPDFESPLDVREKAADAVISGWNQYPPMMGLPILREAIATHYKRFQNLDLHWQSEVMVTSGATEALAVSLLALLTPGDEVIVFEPAYDAYLPLIKRAGGIPRIITLKPPHFRFSEDDLKSAFNAKTKAVLFNNPLNPTATVFPREDLELLGKYAAKFNAYVISDEVWEHVLFDNASHLSVMNIEALRERSVKISSAGKIFSLTGWKVGLVMASPPIMKVLARAHQYLTFTTPPNLQVAVAHGLMKDDEYFAGMRAEFQAARDYLTHELATLGLSVLPSRGTYFLNVDLKASNINMTDQDLCELLVREFKVAAIPVSAFYSEQPVTSVVRFCFAKKRETLDGALAGIKAFFNTRL